MEKYVNVEPLPPAVIFEELTDANLKLNDFGAIDDDEDEEEEEEEGEEEEGDDEERDEISGQSMSLSKTESGGDRESTASSLLGTVLASTKSPFELLEDED
jgi:hypothetical protein